MLRLTLLSIIVAACLADTVTFSNFESSRLSELQLNGRAAQLNPNEQNFLYLTDPQKKVVGSAFLKNNISLVDLSSFSTFFSFQMTQPGGLGDSDGLGADGFVFVINSVTNIVGNIGRGLGYEGLNRSLAIEFDTFMNSDAGDIDGNHIGIDTNGNVASIGQRSYPTRLNNGDVYYAWIDYNGNNLRLEIRVSNTSVRPDTAFISANLNLGGILRSSSVFVGFTAGTGEGFQNHIIREWTFSNFYNPSSTMCGNGIKEASEECDGGSCCTSDCKLINTPVCFCSRQNFGGSDMGYFCDGRGGFYQCLDPAGPFAAQSSRFDCPAGTQCGCAVGPECSCGKTQSPCVSSYPQVCQN